MEYSVWPFQCRLKGRLDFPSCHIKSHDVLNTEGQLTWQLGAGFGGRQHMTSGHPVIASLGMQDGDSLGCPTIVQVCAASLWVDTPSSNKSHAQFAEPRSAGRLVNAVLCIRAHHSSNEMAARGSCRWGLPTLTLHFVLLIFPEPAP